MGNSETDTDSECFESAEESLDEEEEIKSFKEKNSESKAVGGSNSVDQSLVEKDTSLSYRKRPERIQRSLNNKSTKRISKSPPNETIFKTDKLMPDTFLQDITSNLSKNINKSFNSLQQKSSNVKDLIFSSLPVSSINENLRFSYDDYIVSTFPGKSKLSNTQPNSESIEEDVKNQQQCSEDQKSTTKSENLTVDSLIDSSTIQKPSEVKEDILDVNSVDDFCENNELFTDEKSNFTAEDENIQLVSDDVRKTEKIPEENIKIQSEEKNLTIDKISSISTEPLQEDEKIMKDHDDKINEKESLNFLISHEENKSEVNNLSLTDCGESNNKTEDDPDSSNRLHLEELSEENFDKDNLENIKNDEEGESFTENVQTENKFINFNEPTKLDSQCNLEELKSVLENIVKLEESNSSSNNMENQHSKENISQIKEIKDLNQNSNDGWDDFDFSDNEEENTETSKVDNQMINKNEKIYEESKIVSKEKPSNKNPKISESKIATKVDNLSVSNKNLNKGNNKVIEPFAKTESSTEDNWDWDNWDETTDDNNEKDEISLKLKSPQANENSSDSKWSVWDKFAQKPQEKQGNWGLGSWGVDVLLNKATAVTQGISNVLEAGLGAPDPETLVRMEKEEREKLKEVYPEEELSGEIPKKNSLTNVNLFPVSGITSLVAGVTSKIVEHSKIQEIGTKVITGGLDTLETFGKKTMEVLQEGDPGLKNKRALLLGNNKPVLSQVLKEAREKADREMKKVEEKELDEKCNFETLFDENQGMIHLEALEMLSKQCESKLEQIRSVMNSEEQEDLNGILEEVEQLCALDEFDSDLKTSLLDFKIALQMAVEPLKLDISLNNIFQIHESMKKWLEMFSEREASLAIMHQKLVSVVAELTAATVLQFHKIGELLSIKDCRKTVEEVDALSRLTNVLCSEIERLCEKFISLSHSSNVNRNDENLNSFKEKVTVVMKNSTSYIKQAFDLLIPIIQLGAAA